jgi:hypothetical protein
VDFLEADDVDEFYVQFADEFDTLADWKNPRPNPAQDQILNEISGTTSLFAYLILLFIQF